MPPKIEICIATFRRAALLRKLLDSLLHQETEGKFTYSIIVSDNDANRTAEPVVREYSGMGLEIIYDVEPKQNISLNRNRALSYASGDYIAIIDDDQYVGKRWLFNLYSTIVSFHADVVFGAVLPVFENQTSFWVLKSNAYGVPNFPEGSSQKIIYHTGNCLLRTSLIKHMEYPFDERLGKNGGEDTKFFEALREQGCKMVWSHQGICYEHIPRHRARLSWLLKRHYRIGGTLFQAYKNERCCETIYLAKNMKAIHLLLKIVKELLFFLFFAALSLTDTNNISSATTSILRVCMHTGILSYLMNTKIQLRAGNNIRQNIMPLPRARYYGKLILKEIVAALPLPAPARFVIITRGRTGSNLLDSLLGSHPRVRAGGETIGEYMLRQPEMKKEILALGPALYARRCFDRTGFESVVGIKILYYQVEQRYAQRWGVEGLPEVLDFLKSQEDIKIIHLKRRNRLKTLTSFRVANLINKHFEFKEHVAGANNIRISLTPDECEFEFNRIGQWEKFYDHAFQGKKMLEVLYENLVAEQQVECHRIVDFLGVSRRPLVTPYKKQRTSPLCEAIENYGALKKHFSGTEWARFFDE